MTAAPWPPVEATSYLEAAFVRWVLAAAATPGLAAHVHPQSPVTVGEHTYRVDYVLSGSDLRVAVELDGFAFHGDRAAFIYDRVRQNDLAATGLVVLRFSYDAIRLDTARCVRQLQALMLADPVLAPFVVADPIVPVPDMASDPLWAGAPPTIRAPGGGGFFAGVRGVLNRSPLRACQKDALAALANYYAAGGRNAACVMSVGAGKTALGVAAALAFTQTRALIVTPGSVIRGTFDVALDPASPRNVLYALPGGPLLPDLLPVDAHEFVAAVYDALGGEPFDDDLARTDHARYARLWALSKLAAASVYYLQAQEALGRPPDEREFGAGRHDWPWPGGQDEGWPAYRRTVERLSRQPASSFQPSRVMARPRPSAGADPMAPAAAPITPPVSAPLAVPPPRHEMADDQARDGKPGLLGRLLRWRT